MFVRKCLCPSQSDIFPGNVERQWTLDTTKRFFILGGLSLLYVWIIFHQSSHNHVPAVRTSVTVLILHKKQVHWQSPATIKVLYKLQINNYFLCPFMAVSFHYISLWLFMTRSPCEQEFNCLGSKRSPQRLSPFCSNRKVLFVALKSEVFTGDSYNYWACYVFFVARISTHAWISIQ